jgi:hypothetical protein
MLKKEAPVIEINLETAINRGNNFQVFGKSEVTLPLLFKEYYRLFKVYTTKVPAKEPVKKQKAKPEETKSV